MKKKVYSFALSLVMALAALPSWAQAEGTDVVTQPQFGKQTVTVQTGQELMFYDPKGTADIASSSANNTQSLTVFKPAEEGMSIQMTFDDIDVASDFGSYFGRVYVYNGDPDAADSFEWATSINEINSSSTMPEGDVLEVLDGEYSGKTYYSTTSDGSLSVGMLWRYAKGCKGWTARVKCVKLENMTVSGAGSSYSMVAPSPTGKQAVALAAVYVDANGVLNADHITSISFSFDKNSNMIEPDSIKVYTGEQASFKGATPIDATIVADGDAYRIMLDQPLQQGHNVLTLAADIKADADTDAEATVRITGVTTTGMPDGVAGFKAAEPVTVTNPAIVLMAEGQSTVTVGNTALAFYDDGGQDGKVTSGFNGTTTFLPGEEDKKVQVEFTNVNLSEGTIYYQYLNVYNGTSADSANLIRRVRNGEKVLIHSTSDDGALTVELGNNGTSYTSDGFEATVSLFEPQPMTMDSISVEQASVETVCGGDKAQPMLKINIRTSNTEPALKAGTFTFGTNGTNDIVKAASLFWSGSNASFDKATEVGRTEVTADGFSIKPSEDITLNEGDNYFWLAYDLSDEALNGQTVDAVMTAIELGGKTESVAEGNPAGNRVVENVVYSHAGQGTVTNKVNGSITLRTKNKNDYSSDYEAGTDMRTNVFVPAHEGYICQIDFSAFDLYYSTTSYGAKAVFRVYSGQGTDGELLWELTDADHRTTGPGRTLRSTAADGALTVTFSPNESTSYYTESGFVATVSEYMQQPMAIDSIGVAQTTTDIIPAGSANQELLTLNVVTTGDLKRKSLEAVTLDMKGCATDIDAVKVYAVGQSDAAAGADSTAAGSAQPSADSQTVTVRFDKSVVLAEGNNFFRINVDLNDAAASGTTIDAAVTSVSVSGEDKTIEQGDPEGSRTVKDILLLQQGDNGEIKLKKGTSLMFYDDGGEDGPASQNFAGQVTFAPATQGEAVKIKFISADINCTDSLYVYAGSGTDNDSLMLKVECYGKLPSELVSTAASGKITVRYVVRSNYSAPDGFAMEVTSYRKKALEVASVTTDAMAPAGVLRGQDNVLMMRVNVNVEGDYGQLTINSLALDMADASTIDSVTVFTTDTLSNFAPYQVFGKAQAAPYKVTGNYLVDKSGTYRFWVACTVDRQASTGSTLTTALTSVGTSEGDIAPAKKLTASATVRDGASGTITVGQGKQYGTIQAAIDAISGGIEGPVTISIAPGIYNELVNVPEIPGASAANTITIQSETGNYNDVRLYSNLYNEPPYTDDKMSQEYGVLTISGADYITVKGLELTTTDLTFPGVAFVKGISSHVTIDSCYIHTETTTTYGNNVNLIYTYAKDEANSNNDYLTVKNCLLEGGYIGIRMGGTNTVALPKERGGVIEGNTLRNQGSKAIYVMDELGAKIIRNRIENYVSTASGFQGIDGQLRDAYDESMVIEGNIINLSTPGGAIAINPRQLVGTAEAPVMIVNNEVKVKSNDSSSAGIKIGSPCEHLLIAHNTVLATGNYLSAPLWLNDVMTADVTVANNILQNRANGYAYRLYNANGAQNVKFESNAAFTNGKVFAYNRSDIATAADWKQLTGETGAVNDSVTFLSDEILEPTEGGSLLTAVKLDLVPNDINGTPRAQQPTIGAYEYSVSTSAPQFAEGYPTAVSITDSSAVISLKTGIASKVLVTVRPENDPAPTAADMTAETCSQLTLYAGREASVTTDTLTKGTSYVAYALAVSLRGTEGDITASKPFVASGEVIVEKPNVEVVAEGCTVAAGNEATLTAYVTSGTAPFTLTWTNGRREEIGTAELAETGMSTISYKPDECDLYYVTVTDANGLQASDTCRVIVTGYAVAATMENLWLAPESSWFGPDTKGEQVIGTYYDQQLAGSFVSGSYSFSNNYSLDFGSWTGFAYSNSTSTKYESLADQYNSAVGSGHNGSSTFAVAFDNGKISVLNDAEGDSIRGMYITNSAYALNSIMNGDSYSRKFEDGDYLKIIFTGTHNDGTTSTLEYYLADYTQDKAADHYYVDTWQWVDLRSLGKVTKVEFILDGSDKSYGYLNTPAYFCLDDVNGERETTMGATQTGNEVDLAGLFSFDNSESTITYALPDAAYDGTAEKVELTADGKLKVKINGRFCVTVSATQKGKTQFVSIPFDVADGIGSTISDDDTEAIYDLNGQRLQQTKQGINIIKMKDGTTRKVMVK